MHPLAATASGSPMPGMRSGVGVTNSILVAAFRSSLIHQGLVALLILVSLALIWASVREWLPAFARRGHRSWGRAQAGAAQAPGRFGLRIGFGVLWVLDGIL